MLDRQGLRHPGISKRQVEDKLESHRQSISQQASSTSSTASRSDPAPTGIVLPRVPPATSAMDHNGYRHLINIERSRPAISHSRANVAKNTRPPLDSKSTKITMDQGWWCSSPRANGYLQVSFISFCQMSLRPCRDAPFSPRPGPSRRL